MADRLRSSLGRAYGMGSAHQGTRDWWLMRLSSLALVVLSVWWIVSIVVHAGARYAEFVDWARGPIPAILLALTIVATFHHIALGLQTVIEDYIHGDLAKLASIVAAKFACILVGAIGLFALLRIAFVD